MTLKVGDTIWRFDSNHRVYPERPKDARGKTDYDISRSPIYRGYWVPVEITGETSRSWLTIRGKAPKRAPDLRRQGWAFTQKDVDDDCWVNERLHKLNRALSCGLRRHDPNIREKMEKIAEIIGFKQEEWN